MLYLSLLLKNASFAVNFSETWKCQNQSFEMEFWIVWRKKLFEVSLYIPIYILSYYILAIINNSIIFSVTNFSYKTTYLRGNKKRIKIPTKNYAEYITPPILIIILRSYYWFKSLAIFKTVIPLIDHGTKETCDHRN